MSEISCEVITIGDEILYGHILDTNAKWLSEQLDKLGVKINKRSTISDNHFQITNTIDKSISENDIIIFTGGLGPTNDDITKKTLNKYFKGNLVRDEITYRQIKKIFKRRNFDLTKKNKDQALVPDNCQVLHNIHGTAPGLAFSIKKKLVISLPGVPFEMKSLFNEKCIDLIRVKYNLPIVYHRIIKTVGIGESWLSDLIGKWEKNLDNSLSLAYLPSIGRVKLRLTGKGKNLKKIKLIIQKQEKKLLKIIEKYIYGYDNDELESQVGILLNDQNKTIAISESCSGGYASHMITSIPGSSKYFLGSIIAYNNSIKENILGIDKKIIRDKGAVSKEVVEEMAKNIRIKFKSSIGLSVSGIAGPSGGSTKKPVGTVWIGLSDDKKTYSKKFQLTERRDVNIILSSICILNMLRLNLKGY
tara:strand:+ start:1801 stop:3051 length:1251 start_codon:yes stop_codon:yes gene_type:complete